MKEETLLFTNSTTTGATPHLAYVRIELGKARAGHAFHPVKALHDSGCAASIISKSTFDLIPDVKNIKITPTPNTYVISVTGERTQVLGSATIFLRFNGENDIVNIYPLEVHIHGEIDQPFILGRDFTGSDVKLFETRTHLYLTDVNDVTNSEDFWNRAKYTACCIPIISGKPNTHDLKTNTSTLIPPFSIMPVLCSYMNSDIIPIPISEGKPVLFEVNNVTQSKLQSPEALYQYENANQIYLPIYNNSNDDYLLEPDMHIAEITLWEKSIAVHHVCVSAAEEIVIQAYSSDLRQAQFINEDPTLTEDEKLQHFYDYLETGSYPIPMSTYIENSPSITEMAYKDIRYISDEELEKQFKIDHLPKAHQEYLLKIFRTHMNVFSRHDFDLGCAKDLEMEIQIDETKPRIQKFFPLPHAIRNQAKKILDQFEEYGIIRECNEPSLFCSNLLATKKKDINSIRLLLDGRLLNNATIRLPTNLVTQMEVYAHLSGRRHISTFDISHAFYQVPLSKVSQPLTAFYSHAHGKRYAFQRCPQGLKNSPLFLKLLMDRLLGHLAQYVIHYVDDILIATDSTVKDHCDIIAKVLQKLEEGGIKLRPNKMNILTDTIEFLGIIWKKGKLYIPEAKITAFKNYPRPTTPKKAKAFVMCMSYYRRFLPNFSEISKPIMDLSLLTHHKQFKWTAECETAFKKLIQLMIQYTALNLPDPEKPYYVQSDSSEYCGAGRVFQKDADGNELLLACVSRTYTKTERKYGIFRKETLALLYCLKSMDFYLRFANKLIFLVDAKSILFLRLCKESAGILLRFSLELSKYDAEIYHVPGSENTISDILSREHSSLSELIKAHKSRYILTEAQTEHILRRLSIPEGKHFSREEVQWLLEADSLENPLLINKKHPSSKAKLGKRKLPNDPKTLPERKIKMPRETNRYRPGVLLPVNKIQIQLQPLTMSYTDVRHATKLITSGDITIKQLILAQKQDLHLQKILNRKILPPYFILKDNILFQTKNNRVRLALPKVFISPIVHSKHFSSMGMHFSKTRIRRDICSKFFVHLPTLKEILCALKEACVLCQFNQNQPIHHPYQRFNQVYAPRVTWACDIIPSLPLTKKGNNAMFLAVDMFTGYIQLAPLKSRTTPDLIEAVLRTIITPFGPPKYFRCDSETGMFNSAEFYQFMEPLKIDFLPCSTGAAWSNGMAERAVQTIKLAARKFVQQENAIDTWDDYIHFYAAAHNKSTSVYGYAPEQLHFGYSNPAPADLFQMWPAADTPETYMKLILPIAEKARTEARVKQEKAMKSQLTYRNTRTMKKVFKVGEIVLQRQLQLAVGPGKAMQPRYQGPYVIIEIDKDQSSALIEHLETGQQVHAHFSNITLLNFYPSYNKFPDRYDKQFLKYLPEKDSNEKYFSVKTKKQPSLPAIVQKPLTQIQNLIKDPLLPQQQQQLQLTNKTVSHRTAMQKKPQSIPNSDIVSKGDKENDPPPLSQKFTTTDPPLVGAPLRRSTRIKKPPDIFTQ